MRNRVTMRALCIGVNDYETVRPKLYACIHDAEALGGMLARHGFTTTILRNPSAEEAHDAVAALVADCSGADKVVVTLSGHGNQHNNDNFLLPADFMSAKRGSRQPRDTPRDALAIHADIVAPLQEGNPRGLNVIIADMCRAPTSAFRGRAERGGDEGFVMRRGDTPAGTLVAFSCERGHTSLETDANGLYTGVLLKHLTKHADISKIMRVVNTEVKQLSAGADDPMAPWCEANLESGDMRDIVLIERADGGGGGGGGAVPAPPRAELPTAAMGAARVVALMIAGAASVSVARAGAKALRDIAISDAGMTACVEAGAPLAVVAALTTHAGVADVCEQGCKALGKIAGSDAGRAACAEAGAPRAVVAALTMHAGVAAVCQKGCRALISMAAYDAGRAACVDADAPRALVAALTIHAGEVAVCEYGCGALINMAMSDAGRAACVEAGAPHAVVAALTMHAGVVAVCQKGCRALISMAAYNAGRAACVDADAPRALVAALTTHAGVAAVCENGCWALLYLAWSDPAHRVVIVAAGAVPPLAAAHARHPSAREKAHAALSKLGYTDTGARIVDLPSAAMGAARVMALMGSGVADVSVARAGLEALCGIALSDAGRAACVDAGAPLAVVAALTTHAGAADLCELGCKALSSIAGCDAGVAACVEAGAPRAVVAVLSTHAGVGAVCEEGCRALGFIAARNAGRTACIEARAPRAVVGVLTTHAGVAAVCEKGCWALRSMAASDAGEAACMEAGAPRAVVAALTTHAGVAAVCECGCWALLNLAWSDPARRTAIVAAGAVPLLAAALARHPSAREKARDALERLAFTDTGVKK